MNKINDYKLIENYELIFDEKFDYFYILCYTTEPIGRGVKDE